MTAPTMTTEAATYLAAVERELADLPADERTELLEDLAMHLQALEEEHDERPLESRLGSAVAYAAELRTAAGLPPRGGSRDSLAGRVATLSTWLTNSQGAHALRDFIPQLQPAWWVLRAYLAVLALTVLAHAGAPQDFELRGILIRDVPLPAPFGSHYAGLLLIAVAVIGSVALGRSKPSRGLLSVVVAMNLLLVLTGGWLAVVAQQRLPLRHLETVFVQQPLGGPLQSTHGLVTNIFPFTDDGKPLTNVLLYDQDGRPLRASLQEWWADRCARVLAQPKAADGVPVPQSYPQQYVLDPRGVTLDGVPVGPGQCKQIAPPTVPLPTFPKAPR